MLKFSIITPTLNQSKYIRQTIESVLSQDYENKELIVVDGGSVDSTIDILNEYKNIKWISEQDSGAANAINKGMKMSGGDIVTWLNSDDYYDVNILKEIADIFEHNPDVGIVYGNLTFVDETGKVLWKDYTTGYDLDTLIHKNADAIRQPCTFFRKTLFDLAGGLDESFTCVFDYDLFIKMMKITVTKYVNRNFAFYRDYSDTLTRKFMRKQGREIIKVSMKNNARIYDKIVISSFIKKVLFPKIFFRK
ncbi:MAG: glycosyltransferase family 2 protein [Ignavibacteria bacterium]|nr:glycosyltransferase family 2 protein [Ignavibacteria bacterium]